MAKPVSPAAALRRLVRGNAHYVGGTSKRRAVPASRRRTLAHAQHPIACVVTCSDSRVVPELIFDQSIGDLFVVRNAGTIFTPEVIGSVEFAVEQLGVPLVVVMAHSACGAIGAAVSATPLEGAVAAVVKRLTPLVKQLKRKGYSGAALESEVSRLNTRHVVESLLRRSPHVRQAVTQGEVMIAAAFYELATGEVVWTDR